MARTFAAGFIALLLFISPTASQEKSADGWVTLLGPGSKLVAALKGPGGQLGGILKTIEENAKTKEGEVAPA